MQIWSNWSPIFEDLDLVVYPGRRGTRRSTLGIGLLEPGRRYRIDGPGGGEIMADAAGQARFEVHLNERTQERLAFSGPVYRDHSRGPRHLGGYQGHAWLQLHFTDRPPLACYHAWAMTDGVIGQVLNETVAITADGFTPARISTYLRMTSLADLKRPLVLDIDTGGESLRLAGQPLATMVTSLSEEFDFYYGFPQGQADIVATDQPYLFEGACGPVTGYIQRSMRVTRS